ncbi:putative acetyltransferase [Trypanosoma theileri]|uniref:Putative acetyltransferase n=1 Tax=Trypanosoma theileri TaxID=67003 RepID=A0A1X0NU94_9TRYP|nr:putative acetyltransferase [Trypanosoma theileri]ORC87759.1 putative acetyltransferase [Trypanosoma theileri]
MGGLSFSGFVFLLVLTVCGVCGFVLAFPPVVLLAAARVLLHKRPVGLVHFFNFWYDTVQDMWTGLVSILLECVLQLRLAFTVVCGAKDTPPRLEDVFGPPTQKGKFKIIIMNHRCRIDWLVLFPFLTRAGGSRTLRIVLKAELSRVPIYGWSMQFFRYIFLSRKWDKDEERMREMIAFYKSSGGATILLFPEGTDLSKSNIEKSNAYAAEKGLPIFHHVLNPRSTGLLAMKNMIGVENIEEIVDVTMGYTDFIPGERPQELSVINGRMPKKVHILCTRHYMELKLEEQDKKGQASQDGLSAVPASDNEMHDWLNDRFAKKEILLSQFYANNPVGFEAHQARSVFGEQCKVFTYDQDEDAAKHPGSTKFSRFIRDMGLWRGFIGVLAFWIIPVLYCILFPSKLLMLWSIFCIGFSQWIVHEKGSLLQWLLLQPLGEDGDRKVNISKKGSERKNK